MMSAGTLGDGGHDYYCICLRGSLLTAQVHARSYLYYQIAFGCCQLLSLEPCPVLRRPSLINISYCC